MLLFWSSCYEITAGIKYLTYSTDINVCICVYTTYAYVLKTAQAVSRCGACVCVCAYITKTIKGT
jgi:hypothetical protein